MNDEREASETLRELLRVACTESGWTDLSEGEVMAAIESPEWAGSRMYNWCNHIPTGIKPLWGRLSVESRLSLFITANEAAGREEGWDRPF